MKKNLISLKDISLADYEELDMLEIKGGASGPAEQETHVYALAKCEINNYNANCVPGCGATQPTTK